MTGMRAGTASWRALSSRGFGDLSPPEAEHAALELTTDRARYVGVLRDVGDYPARSVFGQPVPSVEDVDALRRLPGRWRVLVALEDERAISLATGLFSRVFVLDPFYDVGALLYAAWHDPLIREEHARRLAQHAGALARISPLLARDIGVLTPEHLPGSWNPRPAWRKPPPSADPRQLAGWAMRTALVLTYWADRLDAVVCATRADVQAALTVLLGQRAVSATIELGESRDLDSAVQARLASLAPVCQAWDAARQRSRRRTVRDIDQIGKQLSGIGCALALDASPRAWRVSLGAPWVPEPALLMRRVLNGEDPARLPALARRSLRRRPLVLMPDPT